MDDSPIRKVPLILLTVLVCVPAIGVGYVFGGMASFLYTFYAALPDQAPPDPGLAVQGLGNLFGSVGGLLAGMLWSALMIRHVVRGRLTLRGLFGMGVVWGAVVGGLAGMFSHVGMATVTGRQYYVAGLLFGVGAGVFFGLICAGLACAAAWRARPLHYDTQALRRAQAAGEGRA